MKNKILQSVIEITRQRDLDSLEYSLVMTLAELVPVVEVSIFKIFKDNKIDAVEKVIHLTVTKNDNSENKYHWSEALQVISTDSQIEACLKTYETIVHTSDTNHTRLLMPILFDGKIIGALDIRSDEDISLYTHLIEGFVKIYGNYLVIFNESERDKLTGLFNRRTFDNKLQRMFKAQQHKNEQYNSSLEPNERRHHFSNTSAWLAILDIDHFKKVNDDYGHVFGDEVLLTVSQKMKECFRNSDLLFRVGGEEFVIILEPVTPEIASRLIEGFRETVAQIEFAQIGTVTVSLGYAKITVKDFPSTILESADKALYYAKENGRNCVYNYEQLLAENKITPPRKGGAVDLF